MCTEWTSGGKAFGACRWPPTLYLAPRLKKKVRLYVLLFLGFHGLLLNPRCRVLLEMLTGLQLVKKFPAFHGTRRFITALTRVQHLSLSWASPIQSTYPHPTSWRSILILSTHLHLGLPSGLFPSGFTTKTLYTPIQHYVSKLSDLLFPKCLSSTSYTDTLQL